MKYIFFTWNVIIKNILLLKTVKWLSYGIRNDCNTKFLLQGDWNFQKHLVKVVTFFYSNLRFKNLIFSKFK